MTEKTQETTAQVQAAQQQRVLRDRMYDVLNRVGFDARKTHPDAIAAVQAYDDSVAGLIALLGPEAGCYEVDSDLWSQYSDFYKDENGFRPRHHVTRTEVLAFFERLRLKASRKQQFEVTFESTGFTNSKSILDATCSEQEAKAINEAIAATGGFPAGIVGVVRGYITPDDGQGSRDIKVFASVTLLVEAASEDAAEAIEAPETVLTKVTDLMGRDKSGENVLELEEHAWEVVQAEPA